MVSDVLTAYRWFESGQVSHVIGTDPPHVLVEALGHYHATVNSVLAQMRDENMRRARNRPPPR